MRTAQKYMGKKILIIIIAATTASLALYLSLLNYITRDNFSVLAGESSLVLDEGDNNQRKFQGPVIANMSILSALLASKNGGGITFDFKYNLREDGSVILNSINEKISGDGSKTWIFYLNGNPVATEDINKTMIKPGDLIVAKYE